jgi:hypothetical protein
MKARPWIAVCGALAVAFALAGTASAQPPRGGPRPGWDHMDARFGHNHYYPGRGYFVGGLPRDRVVIGGGRYFYSGGVWYAPRGAGFVVIGAPVGVFVPVLPGFYTTVWFGGVPYYYANDTYYQWVPAQNQYEVVAPPGDESAVATSPPPGPPVPTPGGGDLFIYPKNGQSDDQQAKDKYECHKWANQQSGFDPTVAGGGVPPEQNASARAAYNRAISACLDGRGYTVK